jgi:hypothetical protein
MDSTLLPHQKTVLPDFGTYLETNWLNLKGIGLKSQV